MTIRIPGRVVVLDYGEVISFSPADPDRAALVAAAGVAAEPFLAAYHAHRDELDEGLISTTEYWSRVGRDCGASWDLAILQRLWALDFRSWTTADPEVVRLIGELHDGGTRLALLSNAHPDYGSAFRCSPIGALFEQVIVSGELRLLKPDPAIYRHTAEALGVAPEAMVFLDNRQANVRGAESIGVTGHVHTDAASTRAFLESLAE